MVIAETTVPWVPVAHRFETVVSRRVPPVEQVTTAFVLARDGAGRTLLTYVDRPGRGWDVPGGHLDPGESAAEAAVRELAEETGFALAAGQLSVLGFHRITLEAPPPAGYRYPALAHLVFFTATVEGDGAPTRPPAGTESTRAGWLTPAEVERVCGDRMWIALWRVTA
ncbi:NUDIX hydrolase [Nonomuraea longicatena]|uniref:Nudix hydrolase domain-containing protein n=1 Tax=Nonomuraea longicatena TaxID=83682 RepID=A0ABP4A601_9ACTN